SARRRSSLCRQREARARRRLAGRRRLSAARVAARAAASGRRAARADVLAPAGTRYLVNASVTPSPWMVSWPGAAIETARAFSSALGNAGSSEVAPQKARVHTSGPIRNDAPSSEYGPPQVLQSDITAARSSGPNRTV